MTNSRAALKALAEQLAASFSEAGGFLVPLKAGPAPCAPSGLALVDRAVGGGFPRGASVELYGGEGSGKTTLALQAIAAAQARGEGVLFVDAEHNLDAAWAEARGVDCGALLRVRPRTGEQVFEVLAACARSGEIGLAVVDSVAALVPAVELENAGDDGAQAAMMSRGLRGLAGDLGASGMAVVWINQIRDRVDGTGAAFSVAPGGRALRFYARVRARLERPDPAGPAVELIVEKNKQAPPQARARLWIGSEGLRETRNGKPEPKRGER